MKAIITGEDVGATVNFRSAGLHVTLHPWPDETIVSAGRGVVFSRKTRDSYVTLFMEVYPPGAAFIRGQGATPAECEDSCWRQYQLALHCTDGTGVHDWEARGYRNGAGFCTRCSTFGSKVFTGEQLGQFCAQCHEPTMYTWKTGADGVLVFHCQAHAPKRDDADVLADWFAGD